LQRHDVLLRRLSLPLAVRGGLCGALRLLGRFWLVKIVIKAAAAVVGSFGGGGLPRKGVWC
jgi:hypothetical protein